MKKFLSKIVYTICFSTILIACNSKPNSQVKTNDENSSDTTKIDIKYAKGFSVVYKDGYKLVDIKDPEGKSSEIFHYALVNRGSIHKNIPAEYTIIETPVRSVICMTTLQLSNFIKLKATDKIVGLTSTHYLFNKDIKQRIKNGEIQKIGIEGTFDNELILALNPDIILVSPFKRGGYESVKSLDIPLVSFLGYKETTPLGQAEWIKFTAMLLGIEQQANKQFETIEKKYDELKELTRNIVEKPVVMSGELNSGSWYVVGGKSYLAQQFRDAGAEYFLKDNNETGGFTKDFESVYADGANADFWRLLVSRSGENSYDELKKADARYADFKAFKEKKIIYCNLREKPFYENTPVEPEVVLADLIKAFHPQLLPDYSPVYYELMK